MQEEKRRKEKEAQSEKFLDFDEEHANADDELPSEDDYHLEEEDLEKGFRLLCCTTVTEPATFLTHQVDEI